MAEILGSGLGIFLTFLMQNAILILLCFQNLPALVLKIMSGTFAPISDRYSPELRQLILNMLNLDPSKRPQLNEIMALPVCIRPLLNLYTDIGNVKMRRLCLSVCLIARQVS